MYSRWQEGDDPNEPPEGTPAEERHPQFWDPFWEPPEPALVATASVFLQSLAYRLDFRDDTLVLSDYRGTFRSELLYSLFLNSHFEHSLLRVYTVVEATVDNLLVCVRRYTKYEYNTFDLFKLLLHVLV